MTASRVLIVDDSAVVRRMLAGVLDADPDIEVVGTANNGDVALTRIAELQPDIITLDVEMPGLSGLDLLVEIRRRDPKLPVIMFSSLTQRAAATTLEALARGATDYVTKPANTGSREASIEHVRSQLVPKIKGLARAARPLAMPPRVAATPPSPAARVDLVAVASSTGGPNALVQMLCAFTSPLPVPMVVVQHMPPVFTRILAERLAQTSRLPVHEASHGMPIESGHVYVAPGDHHLTIERVGGVSRCALDQAAAENSCRPSADVTFRSVATSYGARAIAVVLTGMGHDGLRGVEMMRGHGAHVIVQDEATSIVWGMPGAIVAHGLADQTLALDRIPAAVIARVAGGRSQRRAG